MRDGSFLGVDIGKSGHYALAVDATGAVVLQRQVANDETDLRKLVVWASEHQAAVIIDQSGGPAALLLQLCWQSEVPIAYLHGSAMARARGFYAGESKTDPKDAFVLADVARAHPDRLVWLERTSEALAHLELLLGYDADLRADANRLMNRLRALLASYWPALERAFGERLETRGALAVLQQYPSGPDLRRAGIPQLTAILAEHHVRQAERFAERLHMAAMAQTVAITGSTTAARLVAELASQLAAVLRRREQLEQEIERAFFALPEAAILHSLPGIGPRLGARIAVEIGSITRFRTPAHLAAYAGMGPTPRQSGSSLRANVPTHYGNHRLKNALFLAAFSSLNHPPSRTYYDRKRAQGKRHAQALLCLARRRVDVLYAMLVHHMPYCTPAPHMTAA